MHGSALHSLHVSLLQKRPCCEYKCVYCDFVEAQRSKTLSHLLSVHRKEIKAEVGGQADSTRKLENLNRRGVRLYSEERLRSKLMCLRPPVLTAQQYKLVNRTVRAVLASAMVVVHDEVYTGRRFRMIKKALAESSR